MLSTPTVLPELREISLQLHHHFHLHPVKLVQIKHITSYDNQNLGLVIKLSKDEDMPLNKTPSPFFPAGKFQQFSDRRCWGLERFRSQVRIQSRNYRVRSHCGFGVSGPREVGSCDLFLDLFFLGDFLAFYHGKLQLNQNLREWFLRFSKHLKQIQVHVRCCTINHWEFLSQIFLWWAGYLYLLLVFVKMLFENLCKQTKVGLGKETSLGKWKTMGFLPRFPAFQVLHSSWTHRGGKPCTSVFQKKNVRLRL